MCLFREGGDGDRDGLARRHWLELGGADWRWGMRWSWARTGLQSRARPVGGAGSLVEQAGLGRSARPGTVAKKKWKRGSSREVFWAKSREK
jgi:hypothetical protein